MEYYKEALKIDREIGNKEGEARQLGNIGIIYVGKSDKEKPLNYFKQALEIFKQIGAKKEIEVIEKWIKSLSDAST